MVLKNIFSRENFPNDEHFVVPAILVVYTGS